MYILDNYVHTINYNKPCPNAGAPPSPSSHQKYYHVRRSRSLRSQHVTGPPGNDDKDSKHSEPRKLPVGPLLFECIPSKNSLRGNAAQAYEIILTFSVGLWPTRTVSTVRSPPILSDVQFQSGSLNAITVMLNCQTKPVSG